MDIFDSNDLEEIIELTNEKDNFAKKWFISYSKLDKTQKEIYNDNTCNFVVKGCAGSGKTILALHKLFKILDNNKEGFDSYLFTVYTKALLRFIQDGIDIYLKEDTSNENLAKFNIDESNIININRVKKSKFSKEKQYLIIDEFQDINEIKFKALVKHFKNIMLFGDDEQQLYYKEDNITVEKIHEILGQDFKTYELNSTYRLPYEVAAFAGEIINSDICKKCKRPPDIKYKPNIIKCQDIFSEIHFIIEEIFNRDLKDVAIIIHNRRSAKSILGIIKKKVAEIYSQDSKRREPQISFKTDDDADNLRFSDENSITVMVFHSSKGTQFENVFIPKCDCNSIWSTKCNYDKALFVACTRTSKNLYITHSSPLTEFISKIDNKKYNSYEYINGRLKRV